MSLALLIGSLVAKAMLIFISFACFAYIYRESRRLPQVSHLKSWSGGFLMLGLTFLASFTSETALHLGGDQVAVLAYRLFLIAATVAPFMLFDGLLRLLGSRFQESRWPVWLFVVVWLLLLGGIFTGSAAADPSQLTLTGNGSVTNGVLLSGWLFLAVGLLVYLRHTRPQPKLQLWAAVSLISWLLALASVAVSYLRVDPYVAVLAVIAWGAFLLATALLGVAGQHDDPVVRQDPFRLVRRSLSLKIAIVQSAMLAILLFGLMLAAVVFFVNQNLDHQRQLIADRSALMASGLEAEQDRLLALLQAFALNDDRLVTAEDGSGGLPSALAELLTVSEGRWLRVIDQDGQLLFGNTGTDGDAAEPAGALVAVTEAQSGLTAVRYETDPKSGTSVLVAAVPIGLADGREAVLAVSAEVEACLNQYRGLASSPDSCGLLGPDGTVIVSTGEPNPADRLASLLPLDGQPERYDLELEGHGLASMTAIRDGRGRLIGYAYSSLASATVQASAVRLATMVILLSLLALTLMLISLMLVLAYILRPIRQLHQASVALEQGDYSVPVSGGQADELGQLSEAFNRMRQTIGQQTQRLQTHIQEQADFMVNTAHEMRTPLNIISWTTDMMRFGDTGRMNKQQLELLEQVRQTTARISGLVQNMRDAAQLQRGDFSLEISAFQVADVIDEVAGHMSVRAANKSVALEWQRPAGDWPLVLGDPQRTYQIILNLVSNAIKYTDSGGRITLTGKLAEASSPDGQAGRYLQLSVSDTGIGIPEDEQPRIFSRFFRGRQALASDIEGAGLGLYLVRQLVERQSGEAWFVSTPGQGTVFSFTLPASEADQAPKADATEPTS
jgi:signal transduction histidine kinase